MTEDGEALRRRLYRPGAADADVAAYLSIADERPSPAEPEAPPILPRRRIGTRTIVGGVVLVALIAGSALALQHLQEGPPSAAAPTPLPTRAVSPATASRFEAALERGDDAGLGAWWDSTAPIVEEHGSGDGTVQLPVSASGTGGRLTVLLVLARDGTAGWSAARLVIHDDRTIHLETEAAAHGSLRAGVPAVGRLVYSAEHRPLRLFVEASAATRWGVAAVITG